MLGPSHISWYSISEAFCRSQIHDHTHKASPNEGELDILRGELKVKRAYGALESDDFTACST